MKPYVIVIPSYEPDEKLFHLIEEIKASELEDVPVVVVNDGSGEAYSSQFRVVEEEFGCVVLNHYVNLGKGRALKTAMNYILQHFSWCEAIVTLDADGQHKVKDVLKCFGAFETHPNHLILGIRDFDQEVPLKNSLGNKITRQVLSLLTGLDLRDTQTGLRVIGRAFMMTLMNVSGERFEFEMNMLLKAKEDEIPIYEQPIETIYIEENKSSHFRVFRDSFSIYATFLKYIISSFSSSAIDILAFMLIMVLINERNPMSITLASFGARFVSATFNYFFNKQLVFRSEGRGSMVKYYLLVVLQISVSALSVSFISYILPFINVALIKICVDMLLFFISFQIQRKYVFK